MANCRALVNHHLYCGRIVLDAWQTGIEQEQVSAKVLQDSFQVGAHHHLGLGYGYLLLEGAGVSEWSQAPPECIKDVPQPASGKAMPAVVTALAREETEVLAPLFQTLQSAVGRRSVNSLATVVHGPSYQDWRDIYEFLERHTTIIRDNLDES
jgi:inactivated superfamily I helicase